MLERTPRIEGRIGYYGLSDWWLSEFTNQEREYIESLYHPMGLGNNPRPLTQGKILESSGRASQLLWGLSTWFKKPDDFTIANCILLKAEELASDPIDLHFTYQMMIQVYYRMRDIYPTALDNAINACKKQISIAPEVAKRMKSELPELELPSHVGYRQLAIILEKRKNYVEAIQLLKQAKDQGWSGDWEERIARYEKKAGIT